MKKQDEDKLVRRLESLEKDLYKMHIKLENQRLDKHVYTVAEVAGMLERTPQAIYAMIARGELASIKVGHVKIPGYEMRRIFGYED